MDALYFGAIIYFVGGMVLYARCISGKATDLFWVGVLTANLFIVIAIWSIAGCVSSILIVVLAFVLSSLYACFVVKRFTGFGVCLLTCNICLVMGVLKFFCDLAGSLGEGVPVKIGAYAFMAVALLVMTKEALWGGLIDFSEFSLRFKKLDDVSKILRVATGKVLPKVSIHVPCYKEPPQLMIDTLDALSKLRYENFEVIVVDNNTKDPSLWQPVEDHCRNLGPRFRFFHVDPLSGAKAGAINFALRHSAPEASIITVVDADYIVEPDFLHTFVPLFVDRQVAFVQTSHDYRKWRCNPFMASVYYYHVYMPYQKITYPAANEYGAANLVGTMCMIRKSMLEEVGGWAEWSLSEDDELALRLQAKGYIGHVFAETWGRGLIPETFGAVKKQLFRWLAGPVQEFRQHWRLHLGISIDGLSVAQKLFRLNRLLGYLVSGFSFVPSLLLLIFSVYCIANSIVASVSGAMWVYILVGVFATHLKIAINVRRLGGRIIKDHLLVFLMANALRWTTVIAFFIPVLKFRIEWVRTDKFKQSASLARAWASSKAETIIAVIYCSISVVLFCFSDIKEFDVVALSAVWMFAQGLMCALVMAVIGERALTGIIPQIATPSLSDVLAPHDTSQNHLLQPRDIL